MPGRQTDRFRKSASLSRLTATFTLALSLCAAAEDGAPQPLN